MSEEGSDPGGLLGRGGTPPVRSGLVSCPCQPLPRQPGGRHREWRRQVGLRRAPRPRPALERTYVRMLVTSRSAYPQRTSKSEWKPMHREELGRPEVHFHDLRGAGLTWAATQGATTRELMARAGHASPAAAL